MKQEARAGTRACAYERLRAIARSSCCFVPFSCCVRVAISPPFGRSVCPLCKTGNSRFQTRTVGYAGWLTQTKEALDDGLRTRTITSAARIQPAVRRLGRDRRRGGLHPPLLGEHQHGEGDRLGT